MKQSTASVALHKAPPCHGDAFLSRGFELFHDADKIAALLDPQSNRTNFPY